MRQFKFAEMRAGRSMARDADLEEDELLDDDSGKGSGADSDEQLPENATEEVRRGPGVSGESLAALGVGASLVCQAVKVVW